MQNYGKYTQTTHPGHANHKHLDIKILVLFQSQSNKVDESCGKKN